MKKMKNTPRGGRPIGKKLREKKAMPRKKSLKRKRTVGGWRGGSGARFD